MENNILKMGLAPVVIAGHSHVHAFQFASTAYNSPVDMVPLPMPREETYGFATKAGPYEDSYWDDLVSHAANKTILIFWQGSQHLAEFLFESSEPFDFFVSRQANLPLQPNAKIVPESMIREYQQASFLSKLGGVIDRIKELPGCRVYVGATPPPKGDDDGLRAMMKKEPHFVEWAKYFGLDLDTSPFTPPLIRLKFWLVIQDLLNEIASSHGVDYIPVPRETQDEQGFLRKEFWENDVGHANHEYGLLFFDVAMGFLQQHESRQYEE